MEEHKEIEVEIKEEIKEEIVEKVEVEDVPLTKPKREKKPRTEKQIAAFEKARLKRMEKLNEKKKEAAKKLLDIKDEPKEVKEEKEEVKELEEDSDLVEEVIEKPKRAPPRKTVKVVKRKKPVKQPKQIVFENSDSDTDDDDLLEQVYTTYKKELKKRKQSRPKEAPAPLERHQGIRNLKFV